MGVWNGMFASAAAFNFLVGGAMLVAPGFVGGRLGLVMGEEADFFLRMAGVLVFALGFGYALAATNPLKHRNIVAVGLISKVLMAGFIAQQALSGAAPMQALEGTAADAAFAAAFGVFLWTNRRA